MDYANGKVETNVLAPTAAVTPVLVVSAQRRRTVSAHYTAPHFKIFASLQAYLMTVFQIENKLMRQCCITEIFICK